ncbi:MAG: WD40 repeat domain-containing protein [Sedimentisphaerales bacterium]|nr:WD40 repeat domain-containing protein [Sedimentisphaerales bacterium]
MIVILMFVSRLRSNFEYELTGPPSGVAKLYTIGDHLVAISKTNEFYLWDWNNLEAKPQKGSIRAKKLLCLDDKRILQIPSGSPGTAIVSNLAGDEVYKSLSLGYNKQCSYMEISGNGRFVVFAMTARAAAANSGALHQLELQLLDTDSYELSYVTKIDLDDATIEVGNVAVSNDGRFIALVGHKNDAGWVALADVSQKQLLWQRVIEQPVELAEIVFSPNGKVVYTGGKGRDVYALETTDGNILRKLEMDKHELPNKKQHVCCIDVTANGSIVAAGTSPANLVYIWDAKTGNRISIISNVCPKVLAGPTILNGLAFSPNSAFFATSDMMASKKIRVWRIPK